MKAIVVTCTVEKIETHNPQCPSVFKLTDIPTQYPHVWAIGNLDILDRNLLGFFCSVKCPGDIILKTYDMVRSFREAKITLIGGFHSPIEKDAFDLLLKGSQPLMVCPARSIENMRISCAWKQAINGGRLLVLSPFEKKDKRVTAPLSKKRNRMIATIGNSFFIPYASPESKTETLCKEIIDSGKKIYTLDARDCRNLLKMGASPIKISNFS